MKIYIAASIPRINEAHILSVILKRHGHILTSLWHDKIDEDHTANYHSSEKAIRDFDCIKNCDMLIELIGDSLSRGGRHCELGLALAWNKRIILIGRDDDCIFTWLPNITKIQTMKQFIAKRVEPNKL